MQVRFDQIHTHRQCLSLSFFRRPFMSSIRNDEWREQGNSLSSVAARFTMPRHRELIAWNAEEKKSKFQWTNNNDTIFWMEYFGNISSNTVLTHVSVWEFKHMHWCEVFCSLRCSLLLLDLEVAINDSIAPELPINCDYSNNNCMNRTIRRMNIES